MLGAGADFWLCHPNVGPLARCYFRSLIQKALRGGIFLRCPNHSRTHRALGLPENQARCSEKAPGHRGGLSSDLVTVTKLSPGRCYQLAGCNACIVKWIRQIHGVVTLGDNDFGGRIRVSHVTRGLNPMRIKRIAGNTPECYQVLPPLPG